MAVIVSVNTALLLKDSSQIQSINWNLSSLTILYILTPVGNLSQNNKSLSLKEKEPKMVIKESQLTI